MKKKLYMIISLFYLITSCTGIPHAHGDFTYTNKLNKDYTLCVQTVIANGANFSDSFLELPGRMIVMKLRKNGLSAVYKQELIPSDFIYYLEIRIYEYEYMKNFSVHFSSYMEVSIKDIRGIELAVVSSKTDSSLSAAHAECLNALVSECVNSIISIVSKK